MGTSDSDVDALLEEIGVSETPPPVQKESLESIDHLLDSMMQTPEPTPEIPPPQKPIFSRWIASALIGVFAFGLLVGFFAGRAQKVDDSGLAAQMGMLIDRLEQLTQQKELEQKRIEPIDQPKEPESLAPTIPS